MLLRLRLHPFAQLVIPLLHRKSPLPLMTAAVATSATIGGLGLVGLSGPTTHLFHLEQAPNDAPLSAPVAPAPLRSAAALAGAWTKDWEASDSMDATAAAMELPWHLRQGLKLVNRLELKHDGESFSTALSAGLLGIEERYPLSGDERSHRRRDMRSGMSRGAVAVDNDGVVTLRNEWQAPLAGHATEKFTLLDSRTLLVETCMRFTTKNEGVAYRSVYRR